ncbi:MAG: hypothetical protein E4H36_05670 [Spirochaetales bacterium]|nr:MAG: hypothetical protein E4H36_05670 [Spirochaetales bacterium]
MYKIPGAASVCRCLGMDFHLFPVNSNFLSTFTGIVSGAGYTHALVYWGGSFPWRVDKRLSMDSCYREEAAAGFIRQLKKSGVAGMNLLPVFKNLSGILYCGGYRYLRNSSSPPDGINPLETGARKLMEDVLEDVVSLLPDTPVVLDIRGLREYGDRETVCRSYLLPLLRAPGVGGVYADPESLALAAKIWKRKPPAYIFIDGSGAFDQTAGPGSLVCRVRRFTAEGKVLFRGAGAGTLDESSDSSPFCAVFTSDFPEFPEAEAMPAVFFPDRLRAAAGGGGPQNGTPPEELMNAKKMLLGFRRLVLSTWGEVIQVKEMIVHSQKSALIKAEYGLAEEAILVSVGKRIKALEKRAEILAETATPFLEGAGFRILLESKIQCLEEEFVLLKARYSQLG